MDLRRISGAAPRLHRLDSTKLLCGVLAVVVAGRLAMPGLWRVASLQAWTTIFAAVCIQATPYVVLGVLLAAALRATPARWLQRVVPERSGLAVAVAALAGAAMPGCECGSVPVAASLLRRGVRVGPALAFMLAGPGANPIVLVATAAAFPGRPSIVAARFCASILASMVIGFLWRGRPTRSGTDSHRHSGAATELAQALGLLTVGAASAATIRVFVPYAALESLASGAVLGVVSMAGLAVVLAVCSEADAFIAASLTQFSATAQLTFMVVGPMVDVKLIALQAGVFGPRFAARLSAAILVVAGVAAVAVGAVLR